MYSKACIEYNIAINISLGYRMLQIIIYRNIIIISIYYN